MRGELTLKLNGQEVRVFRGANMWLFDTQEGDPCVTYTVREIGSQFHHKQSYTLEQAIDAYEAEVTEAIQEATDFIKRQLGA